MTDKAPLRADAQRNRERILVAAEEVFLEGGASASLDDIARRAGVGIGTLYRRFPTREDLLAATYSARFLTFAESSRSEATELQPIVALRSYLEELVKHTNVYRGLAASLGTVLQVGTPGCIATSQEGQRLLQAAQASGDVRPDIEFADLVCVATAISIATESRSQQEGVISHLAGVFLSGMRTRTGGDR